MGRPRIGAEPLTAAQRKARQRMRDQCANRPTAAQIDALLCKIVREECKHLGQAPRDAGGITRADVVTPLLRKVASRFDPADRPKVWARFGLEMPGNESA